MKITREEVLHVAELAHLELNESEIESFARHLDSILTYSEKLNELNTDGIEPLAHVAPQANTQASGQPSNKSTAQSSAQSSGGHAAQAIPGTPLREDVVVPCEIIGDVLAGAPDPDPPYFRVPKVIER
jgi:aspartyl-tRNA(Asn)/glutamyl-tRNA(Gln) amidotransferase subunit C